MRHCSATKVRNSFGEMMEKAHHDGEVVIVERRNKPFVAIVPLVSVEEGPLSKSLGLPAFDLGQVSSNLSREEIYGEKGR